MSKRVFRLILAAYLVLRDWQLLCYNAIRLVSVSAADIVRQLYGVVRPTGSAAPIGQRSLCRRHLAMCYSLGRSSGYSSIVLECSSIFVILLLVFAAHRTSTPFYIISGWFKVLMHVRLLFHGFIICLIYFGSPREDCMRRSS